MEDFNDYILDAIAIITLKKQPNEESILHILTSEIESITKEKLDN